MLTVAGTGSYCWQCAEESFKTHAAPCASRFACYVEVTKGPRHDCVVVVSVRLVNGNKVASGHLLQPRHLLSVSFWFNFAVSGTQSCSGHLRY
jgi:hypothetical protein